MNNVESTLQTKRLVFRFLTPDDLDVVYRQFSDPEMCRYFSESPCSLEEAREIIAHYHNPQGKTYLRYGLFDRQSGEFIGTCGYHYWDAQRRQVEIGYDIWKTCWRQGYLAEAMPVLLDLCFDALDVDCVYVLVHPENAASLAGARKFGFLPCEPLRPVLAEEGTQACLRLLRSEWRNGWGDALEVADAD